MDLISGDRPKFHELFIRLELRIVPEENPELGLEEEVRTHRGLACKSPTVRSSGDLNRLLAIELATGLRSLEGFLQREGYIDETERWY